MNNKSVLIYAKINYVGINGEGNIHIILEKYTNPEETVKLLSNFKDKECIIFVVLKQ